MTSKSAQAALSPRASKLLVELVIGIIGLLGIMLAQTLEPNLNQTLLKLQAGEQAVTLEMSQQQPRVNWLDLLL